MTTAISVSILSIINNTIIIIGCICLMYRIIKKCKTVEKIKDSQNRVIGYKKKGSILITIFLIVLLSCILTIALFNAILNIFDIILIS